MLAPRGVEPAAGPGPQAHVAGPTAVVCQCSLGWRSSRHRPARPALNRVFFRLVPRAAPCGLYDYPPPFGLAEYDPRFRARPSPKTT